MNPSNRTRAVLLLPVLLAGCLGDAESGAPAGALADPPSTDLMSATVLRWEGFMRASGAFEVPWAVKELAPALDPLGLGSTSFLLQLNETPEDLVATFEWEAQGGRFKFMLVPPGDDADGYANPIETEVSEQSPLCMRMPPDSLRAGAWGVMVHSVVAVDATFSVTVKVTGGPAQIVDEPFRGSLKDMPPVVLDKVIADATGQEAMPLPCDEEQAEAESPTPAAAAAGCTLGESRTFAQVPEPGNPFGVAVDADRVYVSTSRGFLTHPGDGHEKVFAFDGHGSLVDSLDIETMPGATMGLWDLALDAHGDGKRLYIVDMNGRILRSDLGDTMGEAVTYATIPLPYSAAQWSGSMSLGAAFGPDGSLYVADDHARIWRVPPGDEASLWLDSTELLGAMVLFPGPNGLRFGPDGDLYVAVTMSGSPEHAAQGVVFRVKAVEAPTDEDVSVFATFVPSPGQAPPGLTGIAFGASGTLYASLVLWDQVAVVGPDGANLGPLSVPGLSGPFGLAFRGEELLIAGSDALNPVATPDNWRIFAVCVGEEGLPLHVPTTIP